MGLNIYIRMIWENASTLSSTEHFSECDLSLSAVVQNVRQVRVGQLELIE